MEDMEELFRSMAKRGRQSKSQLFFAFTATPKHKTLAVFGRGGLPVHRYTMRQAIEEGFILDVLRHYTTYATYFRLLKACPNDPNVEQKQAARALAQYLRPASRIISPRRPGSWSSTSRRSRATELAAGPKAMVLTGSRLEAVRYKQSFDRYIREKGYAIRTLVAFSGTVQDDEIAGRDLH